MIWLVVFLVLLVLGLWLVWTLTSSLLGVILTLIIAGIVGWLADLIVPGRLPFGWLGAIVAGLIGSWLGVMLFGSIGPVLAGIPVISALIGAVIFAFIVSLILKLGAGQRTV